jgi:hypothetical protein
MQKLSLILFLLCISPFFTLQAQTRIETDLSGKGWKLWYDKNASWNADKLFLPSAKIHSIPAASPTGGWNSLHAAEARDVSVPGTVEEYLQKKPGPEGDINRHRFLGEEGAISTPPRLEKIKAELEASPNKGWDGGMYLDWFQTFDNFITRKNLRSSFPSVDALTVAMGNISIEHQGRKIETIRLDNYTDGYAINGWESEIVENHSGVG